MRVLRRRPVHRARRLSVRAELPAGVPFMGDEIALKGISAMVVGGMGNIWGAIVGGLLIGVVETFSITWLRRARGGHRRVRASARDPLRAADRHPRRHRAPAADAEMSGYLESVLVCWRSTPCSPTRPSCRWRRAAQPRRRRLHRHRRLQRRLPVANATACTPVAAGARRRSPSPAWWDGWWRSRPAHARHLPRARHFRAQRGGAGHDAQPHVVGGASGYPVTGAHRLRGGRRPSPCWWCSPSWRSSTRASASASSR